MAVLRGHRDVAKAILQIARLQYKPQETEGREKFSLRVADQNGGCSDDDASSTGDEIRIRREVIHDEFTIDNVGEIATTVESNVTPLQVLSTHCAAYLFAENETIFIDMDRGHYTYDTLIEFAIWHDNVELLTFLLDLGQAMSDIEGGDNDPFHTYVSNNEFRIATRLGHLRCLSELIKRTGIGLPLDELVKQNGNDEIKETPKYYQGLSIHGKKRADWAAAGRETDLPEPENVHPPLLEAASEGCLASVEWFLSTAPGRHYADFANENKQDKRLQRLAKTEKGIEGSIMSWLSLRSKYFCGLKV